MRLGNCYETLTDRTKRKAYDAGTLQTRRSSRKDSSREEHLERVFGAYGGPGSLPQEGIFFGGREVDPAFATTKPARDSSLPCTGGRRVFRIVGRATRIGRALDFLYTYENKILWHCKPSPSKDNVDAEAVDMLQCDLSVATDGYFGNQPIRLILDSIEAKPVMQCEQQAPKPEKHEPPLSYTTWHQLYTLIMKIQPRP